MARRVPNIGSRERLLRAGLALARRSGVRRLTVRALAAAAEVNLGSFVYHFGSRDAFLDELIERWYAPLASELALAAAADGDALAHLREALLSLVRWLVKNREFVGHLMLDAAAGEAAAQRFLRSLDRRHPALLLQLIGKAQQQQRLRAADPMHAMLFLMSTLAAPVVLFHIVGQQGIAPPQMLRALAQFTTDGAAIETRLEWALRGLAPEGERR
jgi:AcrR family transcriptional regulator